MGDGWLERLYRSTRSPQKVGSTPTIGVMFYINGYWVHDQDHVDFRVSVETCVQ